MNTHKIEGGHSIRLAIVREFINFGMTDPEELVKLFSKQPDFDYDKTMYQVQSLLRRPSKIWRRDRMVEEFGHLLECNKCTYHNCKKYADYMDI